MNSEEVERLISLDIDGELEPGDREQLEALMADQPKWNALRNELLAQKEVCKTQTPSPSPAVFDALQQRITRKYKPRAPIYRIFNTKFAVAAALLLAFLAGYFVPRQVTPEGPAISFTETPELKNDLFRAKTEYLSAINRLEALAEAHIDQMPPEVAIQVANNLQVVDQAIAACEDFAIAYPNHYVAHASLAKAYQAKVDLLQTLVEGSYTRS